MADERPDPPKVCLGFDIHYPCYLNSEFRPDLARGKRNPQEIYFNSQVQEDLDRVVERSFRPTTAILAAMLDEGMKCALSISGVVVEQLERWEPEILDLLAEVAAHPNAEVLAQTYYHSVSGLFEDKSEFTDEILLHRELMAERFGATPTIFAHTEYPLSAATADALSGIGITGVIIEGYEATISEINSNNLYTYRGLPVLITHCDLSDDVAVRFPWREWDRWPLMADTFAEWVAVSPGDCVNILFDCRIFGDSIGAESGILDFLRALPSAFASRGVETVHPSAITGLAPHGELVGIEEQARSVGSQDWQINIMQQSALQALERAGGLVKDRKSWRCLLETEHLRRMAMRSSACGRPYYSSSHQATYEYFSRFMSILSHLEERAALASRSRKAAYALRCLPPEKAFHFSSHNRPAGYAAHSLEEFADILEFAPDSVFEYHTGRGDFARWIDHVIGDATLAGRIEGATNRTEFQSAVKARIQELWRRLR